MLKQVVDIITIMLLMVNPAMPINSEGFMIHSYVKITLYLNREGVTGS